MRSRVAKRSREDGATLILALIIITTVSLVTGALLAQGWTNFAATASLRKVASTSYAVDAAAKVAIQDLVQGGSSTVPKTSVANGKPAGTCGNPGGVACYPNGAAGTPASWVFDNNTDGTGCFGRDATAPTSPLDRIALPGIATGQSATVVCRPVVGTGLFDSGNGTVLVQPSATDPFARALTTFGNAACLAQVSGGICSDGITLKGLGDDIPVRGGVESSSFINVSAGTLRTNGTVLVPNPGNCTGSIQPPCTAGFVTPTPPASPLSAVPPFIDPATQGCDFHPGFYNSGDALTTAIQNNCSGQVTHFESGTYYFDFADGKPWDISTTVLGGELTSDTAIPGRCVSPIDSATTPGVQFVFGYKSYVQVEDTAHVELCGPANGGNAPLTIFQQQSGSTPATQTLPKATAATVTTSNAGKNDAFSAASPPSAALSTALANTGNPTADWKSTKNANTGQLNLQNFAGLSSIPVGSAITSAKLNVTYTSGLSVGGTFTAGVAGQPATVPVGPSGNDTDITALLAAQFESGAFTATNPKIQLLVAGSTKGDTMSVDATTLAVTYVLPALRGAVTPATFITDHGGNFQGQFVVQGATYAPHGYITLTPGSTPGSLIAFRWGVAAWGVNFKSLPSQLWGYPLISIPDAGYGLGSAVTAVDLSVYLCSGAGPCSTSGTPSLTSRVQLVDGVDANGIVRPVAGQRQVQIISWSEQR